MEASGIIPRNRPSEFPRLKVYVAPVNIDYIKARFPKESPALAAQFRAGLQKDIRNVLENKSKQTGGRMKWQLVDRPVPGSVTLRLAIVKLKPTDVGGNIMSDLVSLVSPLPGTSLILGRFMSGDVGIEGRLSNTNTDAGIMESKAYNTDPITLFSVKELNVLPSTNGIAAFFQLHCRYFQGWSRQQYSQNRGLTWTRFKRPFRTILSRLSFQVHRKRIPEPSAWP
ncbi:MAG: hypothetical protein ACLRPT_03950 [Akkermansia muciniphila]